MGAYNSNANYVNTNYLLLARIRTQTTVAPDFRVDCA